jgi:hypothetical protein
MNIISRFSPSQNNSNKSVGIIQSSYIPWRGYFDFINSVDVFVIYLAMFLY